MAQNLLLHKKLCQKVAQNCIGIYKLCQKVAQNFTVEKNCSKIEEKIFSTVKILQIF